MGTAESLILHSKLNYHSMNGNLILAFKRIRLFISNLLSIHYSKLAIPITRR